jgi:catechol 2,3-dioxygenase-like lactoylglutathione lyase family enzyme
MNPHFSHLFVAVLDLHATHRFYVELLGLEVLVGGPERTYMRLGGGGGFHIGFEVVVADAVPTDGIQIRVRVDDVDAVYRRLLQAGVAVDGPPADQVWGARHVWLRDPTGYRISIFSTDGPNLP